MTAVVKEKQQIIQHSVVDNMPSSTPLAGIQWESNFRKFCIVRISAPIQREIVAATHKQTLQ